MVESESAPAWYSWKVNHFRLSSAFDAVNHEDIACGINAFQEPTTTRLGLHVHVCMVEMLSRSDE